MAKSRKQILQELLDLENEKVETLEEVEEIPAVKNESHNEIDDTKNAVEKQKKPRTQKQLEAFEKAKAIRDANALKRKEEAQRKAEELRKKDEEKIIKKAIALKKKQLKQRKIIDEISSDESETEIKKPVIQAVKVPLEKKKEPTDKPVEIPTKPQIKINFF